jgi:hypothetical protein
LSKLDEIKEIFFGEGYTISNNKGLDEKGLGQWVDDTLWLIEKVEEYETALKEITLIHNYNGFKAKDIARIVLED